MTARITPASVHREPWARAVMQLDDELAPDLDNLAELCGAIPLRVWTDILLEPSASLARAADFLPAMPPAEAQTRTMALADTALLARTADQVSLLLSVAGRPRGGVLETGAGWGALSRILLKYVPVGSLTCVETDLRLRRLIPPGPFADLFRPVLEGAEPEPAVAPDPESSSDGEQGDGEPSGEDAPTAYAPDTAAAADTPDAADEPTAAPEPEPQSIEPVELPREQSLTVSLREFLAMDEDAFVSRLGELADTLAPGGTLVIRTRAPEYWLQPHLDDPDRVAETRRTGFCHAAQGTTVSRDFIAEQMIAVGLSRPRAEWLPAEPNLTWWAATRVRG